MKSKIKNQKAKIQIKNKKELCRPEKTEYA
jgi:hypothetical protein